MTDPMWRDANPDLDHEYADPLPVIHAFGDVTVRATGHLDSVNVVDDETRQMEHIGAIIEPGRSWRALVRERIATYHDMLSSNPGSIYGVY